LVMMPCSCNVPPLVASNVPVLTVGLLLLRLGCRISGVDWLALIVPALFRARLTLVPMAPDPSIVELLFSVRLNWSASIELLALLPRTRAPLQSRVIVPPLVPFNEILVPVPAS
jgi:hypothetical protein